MPRSSHLSSCVYYTSVIINIIIIMALGDKKDTLTQDVHGNLWLSLNDESSMRPRICLHAPLTTGYGRISTLFKWAYLKKYCLHTESIKNILGKNVKIIERRAVRLETKGDKTENRILVSHIISCWEASRLIICNFFRFSLLAACLFSLPRTQQKLISTFIIWIFKPLKARNFPR